MEQLVPVVRLTVVGFFGSERKNFGTLVTKAVEGGDRSKAG